MRSAQCQDTRCEGHPRNAHFDNLHLELRADELPAAAKIAIAVLYLSVAACALWVFKH